jgi:hypothetical protein
MNVAMHILKSRPDGLAYNRCIASADASGLDYRVINNRGLDVLTGRYNGFNCDATHITMLDDDDETLLTKEVAESLASLGKPAVFTNSEIIGGIHSAYNIPKYINKWSWDHEVNRVCRPHASLILEKQFAIDTLKETKRIINSNNWDRNTCDYVFRLIISTSVGWHYSPEVTYRWYHHNDNLHRKDVDGLNCIREYFINYARNNNTSRA